MHFHTFIDTFKEREPKQIFHSRFIDSRFEIIDYIR